MCHNHTFILSAPILLYIVKSFKYYTGAVFDFDEVVSRVVRCSQWHSSGFNTWACFVHYLHQ